VLWRVFIGQKPLIGPIRRGVISTVTFLCSGGGGIVDKRVHEWHNLKQDAEIGNVEAALYVSANVTAI
jgi:hypothetical protein